MKAAMSEKDYKNTDEYRDEMKEFYANDKRIKWSSDYAPVAQKDVSQNTQNDEG